MEPFKLAWKIEPSHSESGVKIHAVKGNHRITYVVPLPKLRGNHWVQDISVVRRELVVPRAGPVVPEQPASGDEHYGWPLATILKLLHAFANTEQAEVHWTEAGESSYLLNRLGFKRDTREGYGNYHLIIKPGREVNLSEEEAKALKFMLQYAK